MSTVLKLIRPNSLHAVLAISLKKMGCDPAADNAGDRRYLQNMIYLTQKTGIDLGYRYTCLGHGAFSTKLSDDLHTIRSVGTEKICSDHQLRPEYEERFATVVKISSPPRNVRLFRTDWVQLLQQVLFLRTETSFDDAEISRQLGVVPGFQEHQKAAVSALQKRGFLQ